MPYTTTDDVLALAPQLTFGAATRPTLAQVTQMLSDVAAEADAAFRNLGYVTPVTGDISTLLAKNIVAYGVLARVLYARSFGIGDADHQGASAAQKIYRDYLDRLADPKDQTVELVDAQRSSRGPDKDPLDSIRGMGTGLIDDSYDPDNPTVRRGQVF